MTARQIAPWLAVLAAAYTFACHSNAAGQAVSETAAAANLDTATEASVSIGGSRIIRPPAPVVRVAVANPDIADVKVLQPLEVLIVGKSAGATDLLMWDEAGGQTHMHLRVSVDLPRLNEQLTTLFPDGAVTISVSGDVYFANGALAQADDVVQLRRFLEASGLKYVDMTKLAGVQQVQIQVRVAEVNRTAIRKLSINALWTGDDDFFGASLTGSERGGALNPVSIGVGEGTRAKPNLPFIFTEDTSVSPLATLLAGFPSSDLEFFIQALAENQYLQILAEPNLIALSGEEATFLAGGEFPIPVVQGTTAGGGTSVTIEYKEFGVRLKFRPTILGDGGIRLHVAPEVSELSDVGAVEIEGFNIPSLLTRRSETTVELKSGQTFAMAGLLNKAVDARNSRLPLIGDIPLLGNSFRSTRYRTGESELVILVTAQLVEPLSTTAKGPLPGDQHEAPNDWAFFIQGCLERRLPRGAQPADTAGEMEELGKLKGPGAWASFQK